MFLISPVTFQSSGAKCLVLNNGNRFGFSLMFGLHSWAQFSIDANYWYWLVFTVRTYSTFPCSTNCSFLRIKLKLVLLVMIWVVECFIPTKTKKSFSLRTCHTFAWLEENHIFEQHNTLLYINSEIRKTYVWLYLISLFCLYLTFGKGPIITFGIVIGFNL